MASKLATATVNFTLANGLGIYQGSEWSIPVAVSDRDGNGEESVIDLTDYIGRCSIKKEANYDMPILQPTVEMTNPKQGQFTLRLTSEETDISQIMGETYDDVQVFQYDVFLESPSGESTRVMQGYVEVSPSVTKENE